FFGNAVFSNQYRFGGKHVGKRFQSVAFQRAAGGNNIADGIAQPQVRGDFNRSADHPDIGLYLVFLQEFLQDIRLGSGDGLSGQILQTGNCAVIGNGDLQRAFSKTKPVQVGNIRTGFGNDILSNDTQVGGTVLYVFGDVVVPEKQDLQGKILHRRNQRTLEVFKIEPADRKSVVKAE